MNMVWASGSLHSQLSSHKRGSNTEKKVIVTDALEAKSPFFWETVEQSAKSICVGPKDLSCSSDFINQ